MPLLTSGQVDKINLAARMLGVELPNKRPTEYDAWLLSRAALNYALRKAREAKTAKQKAVWTQTYQQCHSMLETGRN